jgi:hypothetical protein
VDVVPNFPEQCRYVLESLGKVYGYNAQAEEQGLSPEERLRFHREHSQPVMDKLHAWLQAQFDEKESNRTPAWAWGSPTSSVAGIG